MAEKLIADNCKAPPRVRVAWEQVEAGLVLLAGTEVKSLRATAALRSPGSLRRCSRRGSAAARGRDRDLRPGKPRSPRSDPHPCCCCTAAIRPDLLGQIREKVSDVRTRLCSYFKDGTCRRACARPGMDVRDSAAPSPIATRNVDIERASFKSSAGAAWQQRERVVTRLRAGPARQNYPRSRKPPEAAGATDVLRPRQEALRDGAPRTTMAFCRFATLVAGPWNDVQAHARRREDPTSLVQPYVGHRGSVGVRLDKAATLNELCRDRWRRRNSRSRWRKSSRQRRAGAVRCAFEAEIY